MKSFLVLGVVSVLSLSPTASAQSQPQFVLSWGGFNEPRGMAVDSHGNVYVADLNNSRVRKFDSDGNFILQWGTFGSGPGQFWGPWDIAIDQHNNVYSVEANDTHRVQKFDSNGNFITMWGSYGTDDGQFRNPVGIAVDVTGNVYVADTSNSRVQKFDGNGNFILKWFAPSTPLGSQFSGPSGLAVDTERNVYVVDAFCRVVKFDSVGTFLTEWPTLCRPYDVAADRDGNLYVAEGGPFTGAARAAIFTSEGRLVVRWGANGQFSDPRGITVGPAASGVSIYVSDFQYHDVQKFAFTPTAVQPHTWSDVKKGYRE